MLLPILSLALATTSPNQARADWYECLEIYSQTAMFTRMSSATLAMKALAVCSSERRAFQMQLLRTPSSTQSKADGPAFAAMLREEDSKAALHVMTFLSRNRPKT